MNFKSILSLFLLLNFWNLPAQSSTPILHQFPIEVALQALHLKTVFKYDQERLVERKYYNDNELCWTETLLWEKDEKRNRYDNIAITWEDNQENTVHSEIFTYDSNGNPVLETHNGPNEIETKISRVYSETKPYRLLSEQQNDLQTIHIYNEGSLNKIAELTKSGQGIVKRRFFEYDLNENLKGIHTDNGSSQEMHDRLGVTDRSATFFTYTQNGFPETAEEYHFEADVGNYILLKRSLYGYDNEGNIQTKQVFNKDNILLLTATYTYNVQGRVIKETEEEELSLETKYGMLNDLFSETALEDLCISRVTIYTYDSNDRLSMIERFNHMGRIDHTFTHDGNDEDQAPSLWERTKQWFYSIGEALVAFRDSVSYTNYIQEDWDRIAESVIDKGYLQFSGYYSHPIHSGCTEYGEEINDKVRVTLINGILNVKDDLDILLKIISDTHGQIPIHYVYRPTEGWTKDLLTSSLSKLGFVSPYAKLLASTWKEKIMEMGGIGQGGKIIHYAHSIGATDTYIARNLLTPGELQMIHVITFGSPTLIPNDCGFGSVINYVSKRDGVCLLDPIGYARGYFYGHSKIELIGSLWGIPLVDHTMYTATYGGMLEKLGEQFIETYR